MADLSNTPTQVLLLAGCTQEDGIASVAINAGNAIYKDASNQWRPAKADSLANLGFQGSTPGKVGIAGNTAAVGQRVNVWLGGPITLGAQAAPGQQVHYVVSAANAGGRAPQADLGTGNYLCSLGFGTNGTDGLNGTVQNTGIMHL